MSDDVDCQKFTLKRLDFELALVTQTQQWVLNETQNFDQQLQQNP